MPMALTLTYFLERFRNRHNGSEGSTRWQTLEAAEQYGVKPGDTTFTSLGIETISHTYKHGQQVQVHAFGGWRDGTVTGLGKTKVKVRYWRNRAMTTQAERAFGAASIWPKQ